jgi:hypothetical protein
MIGYGMPVYSGYASQHGYGLGNVLGGIFRSALPMVGSIAKNAAKSAANTALSSGLQMSKNRMKKKKSGLVNCYATCEEKKNKIYQQVHSYHKKA